MAIRGVALITDMGSYQSQDVIQVTFKYQGFDNTDEQFSNQVNLQAGITGAGLKSNITDMVKQFYSDNSWSWNNLLDSIQLVGGIL